MAIRVCTDFHSMTLNVSGYIILDLTALMESLNVWYFLDTYLPFILPGELGFELLLALLTVSIRDDFVWDCLPADESGLLTAPRTLVVLGWNEKCISLSIWLKPEEIYRRNHKSLSKYLHTNHTHKYAYP